MARDKSLRSWRRAAGWRHAPGVPDANQPTAERAPRESSCNDRGVPRRVAITGLGICSAAGWTIAGFWRQVVAGESTATRLDVPGVGPTTAFAIDDVDDRARDRFGQREARRMDRVGKLGTLAAAAALEDAGPHGVPAERIATVVGCVHGGVGTLTESFTAMGSRGPDRLSPLAIPLSLTNTAVASISRTLDLRGPAAVTSTACAAGSDAIGMGLDLVRSGRADLVVAGGAEAPISPFVIAGYRRVGALSRSSRPATEATRPFDTERDGFVVGEGAGMLVLEPMDQAIARGACIYAELAGYASTCDAGHLTDPDPEGLGAARAIASALADAGVTLEQVGYINAHATSTPLGDVAEARALTEVGLSGVAISSTKAVHGHGLGAAGGIEAVAAALALSTGTIPPTANLSSPDIECPLAHVTEPVRAAPDVAISNSFGFGGHNACIVMHAHRA